ncbi:MAG: hypothetical protein QXD27_09530 [Metallosphaera sp.]
MVSSLLIKLLRDKGIDFINIPGDHDTPKVRDEIYTQRLLGESLGLIKMYHKRIDYA